MIIFETTVGKYLEISGTVPMLSFSQGSTEYPEAPFDSHLFEVLSSKLFETTVILSATMKEE